VLRSSITSNTVRKDLLTKADFSNLRHEFCHEFNVEIINIQGEHYLTFRDAVIPFPCFSSC
jgi:hypothetical protein